MIAMKNKLYPPHTFERQPISMRVRRTSCNHVRLKKKMYILIDVVRTFRNYECLKNKLQSQTCNHNRPKNKMFDRRLSNIS